MMKNEVIYADNLSILREMDGNFVDLIYIDPPFNTGKRQKRSRIRAIKDENGDRVGYCGNKYKTVNLYESGFDDKFDNFIEFLKPRLTEAHRVLKENGSFFFHIDYREVHYCKILLDSIFGRDCFMNEIIWAYDFGARSKKKWSAKHDNILWYVKDPNNYTFNYDEMDRIPYMAPSLVGPKKAAIGKTPTDVFWHTIVGTNSKEKTGYPTQKPFNLLQRIVKVHSNVGDLLFDFFAGSGTFGSVALSNNRNFILVDNNKEAIDVMKKRFDSCEVNFK